MKKTRFGQISIPLIKRFIKYKIINYQNTITFDFFFNLYFIWLKQYLFDQYVAPVNVYGSLMAFCHGLNLFFNAKMLSSHNLTFSLRFLALKHLVCYRKTVCNINNLLSNLFFYLNMIWMFAGGWVCL